MAWYIVFVFSTTVHEAAHAFVAMKLGDRTAYHGGQVTLDPTPHMQREPFGMIVIPIITFVLSGWMMGWASAPYDPYWADRYPRRAAWMGLAGPASNFLLVVFAAILIRLGILFGLFAMPDTISFSMVVSTEGIGIARGVATMLSIMFSLNLLLMVFNLLPFPPLDGTALVEFVVGGELAARYRRFSSAPGVRIFGIIIAWNLFSYVFGPVHKFAINALYPGAGYH